MMSVKMKSLDMKLIFEIFINIILLMIQIFGCLTISVWLLFTKFTGINDIFQVNNTIQSISVRDCQASF